MGVTMNFDVIRGRIAALRYDLKMFQRWLNDRGAHLVVDGMAGPMTREAVVDVFTNTNAPAATETEIAALAADLNVPPINLNAVARVESSGGGFDTAGRPKALFERHHFHRYTRGAYSKTIFSDPKAGGYSISSWLKLQQASMRDPMAAFASVSWGKFQVMGGHAFDLGFADPIELAWSTTRSEIAHYDLLRRFIVHNDLVPALRRLSGDPETCRYFARGYNGSGYEMGRYHTKLADAMRELGA